MQIIKSSKHSQLTKPSEQYSISKTSTNPITTSNSTAMSDEKSIQKKLRRVEAEQDFERDMKMQAKYHRYRMKGMSHKEAVEKVSDWEYDRLDEDIAELTEIEKESREKAKK